MNFLSTSALRIRIRIFLGIAFILTGVVLQLLHSSNCIASK